ncbi:universal stress protein [Alkalibacter mobilis]|uniref:universal stress protein n=1 Tax=Alkalibacter mobilis TaxID=2787712 RepID=UPI00189EE520|nr:universal stress protein [Alkalibacter mobilis]MBF7096458.1 universal stress protein [Alkalibacter mobilis]
MKKILIPVDGSDFSKRAAQKGAKIAEAFDSEVILLNVVDIKFAVPAVGTAGFTNAYDLLVKTSKEDSEKILNEAKKEFKNTENVKTELLEGDTATQIIEYAKKNDVDLIIMGSQGLGAGFKRIFIGSVTNKVLHETPITILVVK